MGTHISKVKSVDLDVWTPEQMEVCFNSYVTNPTSILSTVDSEMGEPFSESVLGGAFEGRSCSARAVQHNISLSGLSTDQVLITAN
jgi:hypothetical protein